MKANSEPLFKRMWRVLKIIRPWEYVIGGGVFAEIELPLHLRGKEEANEGEARLVDCRVRAQCREGRKNGRRGRQTSIQGGNETNRGSVAAGLTPEGVLLQSRVTTACSIRRPRPQCTHQLLSFAIILALPRPLHSHYCNGGREAVNAPIPATNNLLM